MKWIILISLGLISCARHDDITVNVPAPASTPKPAPSPKPTHCFENDDEEGFCIDHDHMKRIY